jgi:hypothetical protein
LPAKSVASCQRAVQDDAGEFVREREVLVIVNLVEVARRARIFDELLGRGIFFQRTELGADFDIFIISLIRHCDAPF